MGLIKKILYIINLGFKIRIYIKKPIKKKIIIFDREGSGAMYYKIFAQNNIHVLDIRGESINLYIVFLTIIRLKFTLSEYINQYIKTIKPKFIFHNSYNRRFFLIDKKDFEFNFKMIFTQSELKNRLEFQKVFINLKKPNIDFLFLWNNGMKKFMKKIIDGKIFVTGIFLNNMRPPINKKLLKKNICFISQYRPPKGDIKKKENKTFNRRFSWLQFHKAEIDVAMQLKKYCELKKIKFKIVGSVVDKSNDEKKFYEKFLGKKNWTFLKPKKKERGMALTSHSKHIVTIDSTLGYECLARGQRVSFFCIRDNYINTNYLKFGWPNKLALEGPCWTSKGDTKSFNRIISFLIYGAEHKWKSMKRKQLKNLITYDPSNKQYTEFLKDLRII